MLDDDTARIAEQHSVSTMAYRAEQPIYLLNGDRCHSLKWTTRIDYF
jgi:hypothetical protein